MARGYSVLLILLIFAWLVPTGLRAAEAPASAVFDALPHEWRDDEGASFDLQALRGQPIITTMAYAECHRICPMTIHQLLLLQRRCDEMGVNAQFVVVGYDPESDDAAAWHHYRRTHGLNRPNWHFLVGSPQTVRQFARVLGFEFWKVDDHVMHDSRVVYLDGRGDVLVDPKLDFLNGPLRRDPTPPTLPTS
jgi:protein SCO1